MGESAGGQSVVIGVCDKWRVTSGKWYVTGDRWHLTCNTWYVTPDIWHVPFSLFLSVFTESAPMGRFSHVHLWFCVCVCHWVHFCLRPRIGSEVTWSVSGLSSVVPPLKKKKKEKHTHTQIIVGPPPKKNIYLYKCFYPHRSRDSVSPVCGILFYQCYCLHTQDFFQLFFTLNTL